MKHSILIASVSLALTVSACGEADRTTENAAAENGNGVAAATETYSGTGKVTAIDGNRMTVAHGPIDGIGWPAMTMTFTAPRGLASEVPVGSEVAFSFRNDGGTYVLTAISKQ